MWRVLEEEIHLREKMLKVLHRGHGMDKRSSLIVGGVLNEGRRGQRRTVGLEVENTVFNQFNVDNKTTKV